MRCRRIALVFLMLCLGAASAGAKTTTFKGGGCSHAPCRWSDPAAWDNGVPTQGDAVIVPYTIYESASDQDIAGLEIASLHIRASHQAWFGIGEHLTVTGDVTIVQDRAGLGQERSNIDIVSEGLSVGGNLTMINCRWSEGSATIGGDFYFEGTDEGCDFRPGYGASPFWNVDGDCFVAQASYIDVSGVSFSIGGDFILPAGSCFGPSWIGQATVRLRGASDCQVSLPVPFEGDLSLANEYYESITVEKDSPTAVVILDTPDWGYIWTERLDVIVGEVVLRSDLRFDVIDVAQGGRLSSDSSITMHGNNLYVAGSADLSAPGLSLMLGTLHADQGSVTIAGSPGHMAWVRGRSYWGSQDFVQLISSSNSIQISDAGLARCDAPYGMTVTDCRDLGGNTGITFDGPASVITDLPPAATGLAQNHPNPFNPRTTITFTLAEPAPVTIRIYDLRGALVRTLVDARHIDRSGSVVWDGTTDRGATSAAGAYFYQLETPGHVEARKMTMLK